MNFRKILLSILLLLLFQPLFSQPVINEISASCNTVKDDNANVADWIEIYNSGATTINLQTYYLSDNITLLNKWKFPSVSVASHQFLLVYCTGENRVNGNFIHTNFKIDRNGQRILLTNGSAILDSLTLIDIELNHSVGRFPDGTKTHNIFSNPTPASSNNSSSAFTAYTSSPQFSVSSGFYSVAKDVVLSSPGNTIRYTLDGKEPTTGSTMYSSAIHVTASAIIKAKAWSAANGILPSPTVSKSYFINETGLGTLPVVSITMNPDTFSYIYNNTNYAGDYPQSEAHIEYFNSTLKYETDADLELHGTTSIGLWPQKGFNIKCRKYYHNSSISEVMFPYSKPGIDKFKSFTLRHDYQGGSMWNAYATLASCTMDLDYLAYRPSIVFVNGQYWGEYHLIEQVDGHYIHSNHPEADDDSIDILKQNYDWGNHTNNIYAEEGSTNTFFNDLDSVNNITPASQHFYNYFTTHFDRNNFTDYFVAEIYVGNTDWLGANQGIINNFKMWRNQNAKKWRFILYDCDYSLGIQTPSTDVFLQLFNPGSIAYGAQIFNRAMKNVSLKNYFVNRFADMMNTIYQPSVANEVVFGYRDTLLPAITRHLARWGSSNITNWQNALNTYLIGSALPRVTNLRQQIVQYYTLNKQVSLTFDIIPADGGTINLNTIQVSDSGWSGIYFDGVPIDAKALAKPGYLFDHWEIQGQSGKIMLDSIHSNFDSSRVIKLYFKKDYTGINQLVENGIKIFPNPANDKLTMDNGQWTISSFEIRNLLGQTVMTKSVTKGTTKTDIDVSNLYEGVYFLRLETKDGWQVRKFVKE